VRNIVDVVEVVETALAMISVPIGIEVVRYFREVITFKVDLELMAIALSSIIQNAIQAMPEGGKIKIGCVRSEDPKGLSISISDMGEGIQPENIGRIFDPLFTTNA
jgi:signal transduction histidine kinase